MAVFEGSTTDDVLQRVEAAISNRSLIELVLSDPVGRGDPGPAKQTFRPVSIRGELQYQAALRTGQQEKHENLSGGALSHRVRELFGVAYRDLYLYTTTADVAARQRGRSIRRTVRPPTRVPGPIEHDRRKQYLVPEGVPCPFLQALGVMNAHGAVVRSKQHKFRQINRYLELVDDVYPDLPAEGTLHVADLGCGLSYLTFAVHHLLTAVHQRDVDIIGIDRNPDVIARCRKVTSQLGLKGLRFVVGEIDEQSAGIEPTLHLAISLHACDVATDEALAFAVKKRAQVILAAPCCHHELAGKIDNELLSLMTRHGILKERLAALATDALRAAALEAVGYRTQVIEFIETEHTPKNLLIRAVARNEAVQRERRVRQYEEFRNRLGAKSLASDVLIDRGGRAADA